MMQAVNSGATISRQAGSSSTESAQFKHVRFFAGHACSTAIEACRLSLGHVGAWLHMCVLAGRSVGVVSFSV